MSGGACPTDSIFGEVESSLITFSWMAHAWAGCPRHVLSFLAHFSIKSETRYKKMKKIK